MSNLFAGQNVIVTIPHNQFLADATRYQIGCMSKVNGQYMATLMNGKKVIGAIPENKLKVV